MPNQPATLSLIWTHPDHWRDLNTVDVQLRHEEAMPLWVRFTEGVIGSEATGDRRQHPE